jgi:hypothetical protein
VLTVEGAATYLLARRFAAAVGTVGDVLRNYAGPVLAQVNAVGSARFRKVFSELRVISLVTMVGSSSLLLAIIWIWSERTGSSNSALLIVLVALAGAQVSQLAFGPVGIALYVVGAASVRNKHVIMSLILFLALVPFCAGTAGWLAACSLLAHTLCAILGYRDVMRFHGY